MPRKKLPTGSVHATSIENEQRFCREVVEALSARIEQLVQEAKTEDQQAVVTELRAHEQGLLGATPAAAR